MERRLRIPLGGYIEATRGILPSKKQQRRCLDQLGANNLLLVTTYSLHYRPTDGCCIRQKPVSEDEAGLPTEAAHVAASTLPLSQICNFN